MARSWHYPRWRRYLMQAVMWLIFAGTIALAAYVDHRKHAAQHVELAAASVHGGLSIALPKSWKIEQPTEDNPLVVLTATEPKADDEENDEQVDEFGLPLSGPRKLTVLRERL